MQEDSRGEIKLDSMKISGYLVVELLAVLFFIIGGSLVMQALHLLMWNAPSPDFVDHLPAGAAMLYLIGLPMGIFLLSLGLLLTVWLGSRLALDAHTESVMGNDDEEEDQGVVSVKARCPHCNATYTYHLSDPEANRTITCQNCGHEFEAS
jgi:hypothetical protein